MENGINRFILNKFILGFVHYDTGPAATTVNLFEKALLLDPTVPPEKTETRQIRMSGHLDDVNMNTTSLVSIKGKRDEQGRMIKLLEHKRE